jgi:hypothetical protein
MTDSKQEVCNDGRQVIAVAATIPSDARHSGPSAASVNRREQRRAQRFYGAALLLMLLIAGDLLGSHHNGIGEKVTVDGKVLLNGRNGLQSLFNRPGLDPRWSTHDHNAA